MKIFSLNILNSLTVVGALENNLLKVELYKNNNNI